MNTKPQFKDLGLSYDAALHGVQCAVGFEIHIGASRDTSPEQLRTGVNSAMVEHFALAHILIEKGVITEEEHVEAMRLMMNHELATYQAKHGNKEFR